MKTLIENVLGDFILDTLKRREEQISNQLAYFRSYKGKNKSEVGHPASSWFYVSPSGFIGLTKSGDRYYSALCRPVEKQLADYKEGMLAKIEAALTKYEASELKPVTVLMGPLGLEGVYEIGSGRRVEFRAIMAGGWNIQCLHYRYTVKLL